MSLTCFRKKVYKKHVYKRANIKQMRQSTIYKLKII